MRSGCSARSTTTACMRRVGGARLPLGVGMALAGWPLTKPRWNEWPRKPRHSRTDRSPSSAPGMCASSIRSSTRSPRAGLASRAWPACGKAARAKSSRASATSKSPSSLQSWRTRSASSNETCTLATSRAGAGLFGTRIASSPSVAEPHITLRMRRGLGSSRSLASQSR